MARSLRLSSILILLNGALLFVAVGAVALEAVGLLRRLADTHAEARVEQAGLSALTIVGRSADELLTSARLLVGRPTLKRLVEAQGEPLKQYITTYQAAGRLDGLCVISGTTMILSGPALDWETIMDQSEGKGPVTTIDGVPAIAAWTVSATAPEVRVGLLRLMDDEFSQRVGKEVGLPVRISPGQSLRPHHPQSYLNQTPIADESGKVVAHIETTLDSTEIDRSVRRLIGSLLGTALAVGLVSAALSWLLGVRVSRPLGVLTRAAGRIGSGDLSTPISVVGSADVMILAHNLDRMRSNLRRLTLDLRRQQAEADAILTGINEGVFSVDRERAIRYLNPQAATILGIDASEAIGKFCGDVLKPESVNGEKPCLAHCPILHARFRREVRAVEHLMTRSGRRTVVITSALPLEDTEGEGALQVQVLRDETDMESARRARDTVLATISHEFKTPLSAQLASIELLLDELPDLSTQQVAELVLSLQRGTLRLSQLIDNLLESVRIEAGRLTVRRGPVSLEQVVEEALEAIRPLLAQRGQEAIVELPYPLPTVEGDAARLAQVVVNLLANANKFAPADSSIYIGGAVEGDEILLWVEDEGPGFDGSLLFRPFTRSSGAGSEPEVGGVGLGLWIVKSVMERHGGRVEARTHQGRNRVVITLLRREVKI